MTNKVVAVDEPSDDEQRLQELQDQRDHLADVIDELEDELDWLDPSDPWCSDERAHVTLALREAQRQLELFMTGEHGAELARLRGGNHGPARSINRPSADVALAG